MYVSTRGGAGVRASRAILDGLAPDGGLYVPEAMPRLDPRFWEDRGLSYAGLSADLLSLFLPDFPRAALVSATERASGLFPSDPAPLVRVGDHAFLELFHGPTLAFKDFALSLLGDLVRISADIEGEKAERLILVATSGDTGKAALAGFADRPGIRVLVFYPAEGVSGMQRLQMVTHDSRNASVLGIRGNFDDAQRGVKELFSDRGLAAELSARGLALGSANSINLGRLLPQIAYYVWAYRSALASGFAREGERLDFYVPSGNFGDALAAHYARRMGLPLGRLIVATNENRVLADFFRTGRYDRNRSFFATTSPSMDILAASNLERLVFELASGDPARVRDFMEAFSRTGLAELAPGEARALSAAGIGSGHAGEAEAAAAIREAFDSSGYLMDTHTACAASLHSRLKASGEAGPDPAVIVSTASPFKFPRAVSRALGLAEGRSEFETAESLARKAGLELPLAIRELPALEIRHRKIIDRSEMRQALLNWVEGGKP